MNCDQTDCSLNAIIHYVEVRNRKQEKVTHLCATHATLRRKVYHVNERFQPTPFISADRGSDRLMDLACISVHDLKYESHIVLADSQGATLSIRSGTCEFHILRAMIAKDYAQPLWPEVFAQVMTNYQGRLDRFRIKAKDASGVYECEAMFSMQSKLFPVRMRASDGIALAIAGEAPILVNPALVAYEEC